MKNRLRRLMDRFFIWLTGRVMEANLRREKEIRAELEQSSDELPVFDIGTHEPRRATIEQIVKGYDKP